MDRRDDEHRQGGVVPLRGMSGIDRPNGNGNGNGHADGNGNGNGNGHAGGNGNGSAPAAPSREPHFVDLTALELPYTFGHSAPRPARVDRSFHGVSIVVPLHNEAPTLRALCEGIGRALAGTAGSYEILLVDDGSADESAAVMDEIARTNNHVRPIVLRRNFGKAAALWAGFSEARGHTIITMDADLQDDPAEIPNLLAALDAGADLVSGWKVDRRDPLSRRLASRVFNWASRRLSGSELHDANCGLKAYRAECAREVLDDCHGELHRYLPALANARGFRVAEIPVRHFPREHGRSRYGMERYLRGLFDLWTTIYFVRYARRPMHLFGAATIVAGLVAAALALAPPILAAFGLASHWTIFVPAAAICGIAAVQIALAGMMAESSLRDRGAGVPYRAQIVLPDTPEVRPAANWAVER